MKYVVTEPWDVPHWESFIPREYQDLHDMAQQFAKRYVTFGENSGNMSHWENGFNCGRRLAAQSILRRMRGVRGAARRAWSAYPKDPPSTLTIECPDDTDPEAFLRSAGVAFEKVEAVSP